MSEEIKSRIYLDEKLENKDFTFGENKYYYPAIIVYPDGTEKKALLTEHRIGVITERAEKNIEDFPEEKRSGGIFSFLFR